MNAIEQIMQAFGATATQQSSLFGAGNADTEAGQVLAGQFAEALQQSTAPSASGAVWMPTNSQALDTYIAPDIESTAELDALIGATTTGDAATTDAPDYTLPALDGIPGLQLVQLSGLELTSLIQSGQLQPQTASDLASSPPASDDIFLFAAGVNSQSGGIHFLPLAQLEAVSLPPQSGAEGSLLPQGQIATTPEALIAALDSVAKTTLSATAAAPLLETLASTEHSPEIEASLESLVAQAKPAQATQKAETTAQAVDLDIVAAEEAAVEAHLVATATAQAKAGKQAQNGPTAQSAQPTAANAQTAQASVAATAAQKAGDQASAKASSKETISAPSATDATNTASVTAMVAPARAAAELMRQQPIAWTPETITGTGDGSATEAVAAGLGGLKGESNFMSSMSLLGGKPSPEMSRQIAKQLSLGISRAAKNGNDEFTMRLNPAELGSVKVKMIFGADGSVSAKVMAERPETLELLQRESRALERALETGGHKADTNGIAFSLDTGDGESAGKAFAEAVQQDAHKEQKNARTSASDETDDAGLNDEMSADELNALLANITPETGLDVRV